MKNKMMRKNQILGMLLIVALAGIGFESFQIHGISTANQALQKGEVLNTELFQFHQKFADAYQQGIAKNYKHAVQNYGQLLQPPKKHDNDDYQPDDLMKSNVHFNIGNQLFKSGLQRLVEADGALQEQAKFDYLQARAAYEQALKLNPDHQAAKFNLSLLHGVIPQNIKTVAQDPSGMEISNLPQGLP